MTDRSALRHLKDHQNMNNSYSGEVRSLLKHIKHHDDRDGRKDGSLPINELRRILSNCSTFEELEVDWSEVANPLRSFLCTKSMSSETRKAACGALAALGILSLGYFDRYIDLLSECWKEVPARKEERRVLVIQALINTLNSVYEKQCFFPQSTLEKLCDATMVMLDSNNSVIVLTPAMELTLLVSTIVPRHLFIKKYFQDTVDVAIGWLVEEGQEGLTNARLERTKEILLSFVPLWSEKMDLLLNLAKQFMEDMHRLMEEAKSEIDVDSITKMKAIAGTLLLLIKICGQIGTPAASLVVKDVSGEVSTLLNDRSMLVYLSSEKMASIYGIYMEILTTCTQFQTDEAKMEMLNRFIDLSKANLASSHILMRLFAYLTKLASEQRESLSIPMCSILFGPSSILSSLDFSRLLPTELSSLCSLLKTLLNPSILSVLQYAYSAVVVMLKDSLRRLLNCESESEKERTNDEIRITTIIYGLKPILILKNSLIVMLGLSPSLLDLVLLDSALLDGRLQSLHPSLHYVLLHAAYEHCKAHDNYSRTSEWLTGNASAVLGESLSSHNLERIVRAITSLLTSHNLTLRESRVLVTDWLLDLSPSLLLALRSSRCVPPLRRLFDALNEAVRLAPETTSRLRELLSMMEVRLNEQEKGPLNASLTRYSIECSHNEERSIALWNHLKADDLIESYWSTTLFHECPPLDEITSQQFERMMNFLLKRIPPIESANPEKDDEKEKWLMPPSSSSLDIPTYWRLRLMAAAAFAIESRMSTHLGKPRETLNAIHNEMTRVFKESIMKKSQESDDSSLSPHEEWFRVRCLLEFIEILDRLIYRTHSGSMHNLANFNPSPAARHWFKTNESVCTEWFTRLYPSAMGVAYHASAYSQVIRFGQSALAELDKKYCGKGEEPPRICMVVLCWMMKALIEKGEEYDIYGLKEWARYTFSDGLSDWDWMECAALAANARFELAIDECLREMSRTELQEDVKALLQEIILICSVKLRRVDEVVEGMVNEEALERCHQLASFSRVEELKEMGDSPWNLNKGLERTEVWLMTTIKKSELMEARHRLGVEATTVLVMDDDGLLTSRYSSICSIARDVGMRMEKNMKGMENPYAVIQSLASRSIPGVEGLSMCRQRERWASRMGVGREDRLKGIYALAKMACKMENGKVMEEMKKGLGVNNDLLVQLDYAELKCRDLMQSRDRMGDNDRLAFFASHMAPLLTQAYHVYADMSMNDTISSNGSTDSSVWASALAKTTLQMGKMMGEGERFPSDGMSKLHFLVESRREETGLEEKGVILHLSTTLDPTVAKARYELGMHTFNMLEKDKNEERITSILEEQLGASQSSLLVDAITTSGNISELGRKIKERVGVEMNVIERAMCSPNVLSSLWQQFHSRRSLILSNATLELLAFLSHNGDDVSSVRVATTTLSLLSMLTKYSPLHPEVVQQIGEGVMHVDERVWAGILPQLMARLSHPVEGVRQTIVAALMKLGRSFPHTTIFPLVVATRMKEIIEEDRFVDDPATTRTFAPSQGDLLHYRCTSSLLADMAKCYPQLVEDTRVFVDQLHHLNLTEEKWCFVLHQLDMDMNKRLSLMRKECEKTRAIQRMTEEEKKGIMDAKTHLIIGSIYRILCDFWRSTQSKAEKGVEDAVRFVQMNREHVERAFEESEEARTKGDEQARWEAFLRLNVTLGRKASKKGGQLVDITHCIGRLVESGREWSVPLPGQEASNDEVIYLTKVETTCQVLSTKTRPKKMMMRGSDGVDRAFLLKTHEDLRLDERVMQLLRMSNVMMKKMGKRDAPQYTAKTYAVTPLGPLMGLIQWVNGAIPLYSFYRKWQMRENAAVPQGKKAPDGISLKPLELFEKKMKNLLSVNKLDPKVYSDRKAWHPELLKTLYEELCSETSKDLISREMWLKSQTTAHWTKLVKTFTRSTAVMSMLGAVLGLGDRHPDNLLIQLSDFHVIHIDYNVCFDRGRKLRVPETVPFRLTQNIGHAFGVAGIEGLFTYSCSAVLSSLRAHDSLFSLLLHPFIFDPLVDWTFKDSLGNSVSNSITHIVYGNDRRMEPRGMTASTLYMIKMKENEGVLEKMSAEAMDLLETMYCGGGGELTMDNDPLSRWIEMVDDLLWIMRKEEGKGEFLMEERKEVAKCKEVLAWNGATPQNGGTTPVQTLIHLIPKMVDKLNAMNEECKTRNQGMRPVGLPPGLEDSVYKEEKNGVATSIVARVVKRAKGEVGGGGEVISTFDHATQLIRAAESRTNNALMYEGWIGWV
ncbi:hypothetical protein PMAYCL1PPCAC_23532 [Pristionchus mayeri]|uniref:PI3K/PI4K catalytic domain-containing protein n=1 Tax=Pristionchus mayeri TaxID=1317129 RepID=A0AAN5I5P7_9BILA|nr:hypothetical protein PMAYCL1PPCAC_23532 [Pristionchus mayeri]